MSVIRNRTSQVGRAIIRSLALSLGLVIVMWASSIVKADVLPGLPDAIVCSVKDPTGKLPWEQLVYYLSARMADGRTLYKTLMSDPVVLLVDAEGMIDGANLEDCGDRSVDSLRDEGRAFSLANPR